MELQLWLNIHAGQWRWYIAGLAMLESLEALLKPECDLRVQATLMLMCTSDTSLASLPYGPGVTKRGLPSWWGTMMGQA